MANKLDLADAQFIGYHHGKTGGTIIDLVISMGLTKKEWERWKKYYPHYTLAFSSDMDEIDKYFNPSK